MKKEERYERYKHLMGLNSWEISSYRNKNFKLVVNDGPNGLRKPVHQEFDNQNDVITSVCAPSTSALAASFDKKLCYESSSILAKECKAYGTHVLLAPAVNIKSNVLCGRNFEYFSEDPFHAGLSAAYYINGLEENGVGTSIKHYVANNQEFARVTCSSEISTRALNEIYLRVFKYALKHSSPTSVMTSYNRVNGSYVCESDYLINQKLKKEYGFKGFICSDWGAVSRKDVAIHTGLHIEMPFCKREPEYLDKFLDKTFTEEDLVKRDDEFYEVIKKFENTEKTAPNNLDELHEQVCQIAKETIVLAKNEDNYLPFNQKDRILVLGYFAQNSRYIGGGSGWVKAYNPESFTDVLDKNNITYKCVCGCDKEKILISEDELLQLKGQYDKVVLFLGRHDEEESEGRDTKTLELQDIQAQMFKMVKKVFDNFATVIITGSVVNVEEIYHNSKALLINYLSGEGQSYSIFANIFGIHNPCGRLPETWISSVKQNPYMARYESPNAFYTYYDDDIFVGYRLYNKQKSGFMLPFGYGLSYSTFKYQNMNCKVLDKTIEVEVTLTNEGKYDGSEIIQVYVGKEKSNVYRPIKELKQFEKVTLKVGETKTLKLTIDIDDLTIYDPKLEQYVLEDGEYQIYVCKDAETTLFKETVNVNGEEVNPQLEPEKLVRHSLNKDYYFDIPFGVMFNNEDFLTFIKTRRKDINIEDGLDKIRWMEHEPIRNAIQYLNISFQELDELLEYLNSKPHDLSKNEHYIGSGKK